MLRNHTAARAVAWSLLLVGLGAPRPARAQGRTDRRLQRRHDEQDLGHRATAWQGKGLARERARVMALGDAYRGFISANKTEREVVAAALALAARKGFRADLLADRRPRVAPGTRLYAQVHGKLAALIVVGRRPLADGVHLVAAHVDAVRIDLKQNPLYADGNLALLQTHYYGGIKKYQWLSQPLELRGVVVKRDGTQVRVAIGDDPGEPVLVIPDVAAQLARGVDHQEGEEVPGEDLDPVVASTPAAGAGAADPFAAQAARLIERQLGVAIPDLAAAELELVPAGPARDVGLDRALVGGYGQDDRACAYAAVRALLDLGQVPQHTAVVLLADKEEIGSDGNTGARSSFVRRVVAELLEGTGVTSSEQAVDRVLAHSTAWSADVTGAVNPLYPSLYEAENEAYLGSGVVWDRSAVHAELMGYVRRLLARAGIASQPAEWGKAGGSASTEGTILPYLTELGMNGVNVSIPLLSMHAPFELVSKADLYEGYRAYRAFLGD